MQEGNGASDRAKVEFIFRSFFSVPHLVFFFRRAPKKILLEEPIGLRAVQKITMGKRLLSMEGNYVYDAFLTNPGLMLLFSRAKISSVMRKKNCVHLRCEARWGCL